MQITICLCFFVMLSEVLASATIAWSGDIRNLDFAVVDAAAAQELQSGYAQDIAQTLGVDVEAVLDMEGRPGRVSLSSMRLVIPSTSTSEGEASVDTSTATRTTT